MTIKKLLSRQVGILFLIIGFGVYIRSINLFAPLTELHDFRQTQTASSVWLYYKYGFSFFEYHVPMFGGKYWMLELPLYQSFVYGLTKLFGLHDYLGRVVSIISFILSSCSIYYLTLRLLNNKAYAFLSIFLYSLVPINIFFYRSYMIDPSILALYLSTFALAFYWSTQLNRKKITIIFLMFSLVVLSKLTIAASMILPITYLIGRAITKQKQSRRKILLILAGIYIPLIGIAFSLWYQHAQSMNRLSFTLNDGSLKDWYLGTKHFYFPYYQLLIQRFYRDLSILGFLFFFFGSYCVFKMRSHESTILKLWLINGIFYILLFNNLNYIHNYYQLPLYPLIIMVSVTGIKFTTHALGGGKAFFVSTLVALFGLQSYFQYPNYLLRDNPFQDNILSIAAVIQECTKKNGKIIYVWPDADPNHPTVLYYAKRIGYNQDLNKLSGINRLIDYDKEIKSIAIFPVLDEYKNLILKTFSDSKIQINQKCYKDKTLILDII